jgi:hypothetical protein
MNKKGAVELSMTTIIIIVMGITILSLGLVWIRGVFSDVDQISSGAFEQGESQIAEIFGGTDQAVALSPSETSIKQGKTSTASLAINNLGAGSVTVSATVEAKALGGGKADKLVCAFSDTLASASGTSTLNSGQGVTGLKIIVEDKGSDLGTYACVTTISGLAEGEQISTLIVNIEK